MKERIKVKYVDFWGEITSEYFLDILKTRYNVEISDDPDLLFFSVFGDEHWRYKCFKVFYTGENVPPDPRCCDFSFSFQPNSRSNFQFPYFVRDRYFDEFMHDDLPSDIQSLRMRQKKFFCNFVYKNDRAAERIEFCKKLLKYKRVDCPGKVLNNMPNFDNGLHNWPEKLEFMSGYKFTIAFENTKSDYYTTEKLYHPLLVKSIPIYWGNPLVTDYFNPRAFINCNDFSSFDEVIRYVQKVDEDDVLYESMLQEPPVLNNSKLQNMTRQTIEAQVLKIAQNALSARPVSRKFSFPIYRMYKTAPRHIHEKAYGLLGKRKINE